MGKKRYIRSSASIGLDIAGIEPESPVAIAEQHAFRKAVANVEELVVQLMMVLSIIRNLFDCF